ncbi:glycogen debranching protein [Desulfofustis glycolicus]|uniref:Glycogen operon protein n=1 Tax=Desulfofustis glycolicus DSM 9705 TaxID=1121409 RepID=A0A1M5V115_9BACT|nr:isoamylase [Desulfofustis glycolicus]SHH68945.1 glycogen operon protein [Desulfofustis glycolicus DSM 9705]
MKIQTAIEPGTPLPLGPSAGDGWVNLSLFSRHAESVTLVIGDVAASDAATPMEIPLDPTTNRSGDIWHIRLTTDQPLCYGYRIDGSPDEAKGRTFSPDRVLIDPYCRRLLAQSWNTPAGYGSRPCCLVEPETSFDWQGDRPLQTPAEETIIYELHVRGFTRHATSGVAAPGTFRGLTEKIDYLVSLGVTAVELLPVTAWDETDNKFFDPVSGARLLNFWGYNPVNFFALQPGLAERPEAAVSEFKTLVRALHQAGIEVFVDMVFNHSGESDRHGITSSFRGIDNEIYYLLDPETGNYLNYSGCGNSISCNHPVVRRLIIDALRYWILEMHIDGFRFDLAALFSRGTDGAVLTDPPLVEEIAEDPLLRQTKIIAESWDAAGLYQVGTFSAHPRWREWNGRYRDDLRRFLADYDDTVSSLASRLAGSSDLYGPSGRGPLNSINFVTSHDGFTLYDLVSYEKKRNEANGEANRDGESHNLSWNSGHEGDPCPPEIRRLRLCRMRSFFGLLLFSQGIPMLTAGDEFARTQHGNNNAWCQDNETGWVDWTLAESNSDLLRFVRFCIGLRKQHRSFRRSTFFPHERDGLAENHPEISWQSLHPGRQDWSPHCRTLAFLLHDPLDTADFFIMTNGSRDKAARFVVADLPPRPTATSWRRIIDSCAAAPADCCAAESAAIIDAGAHLDVPAMGLIVLQSFPSQQP